MNTIKIKNLAIGLPKKYLWNEDTEISAIGKTSVMNAEIRKSGFINDDVANHQYHGGEDRAVCLYPYEHYALWEQEFGVRLSMPALGENITANGMLEKDVCIGDIFKIGNAIVQVTQGRVPCSTISKYNRVKPFLNRIIQTGLTGYFFRVLKEGYIRNDSNISLIEKHPKGISVLYANQILFHDQNNKKAIREILQVDELAGVWKEKLKKLL